MNKRISIAAVLAVSIAAPAFAGSFLQYQNGSGVSVDTGVQMYLNGSSQAVPVSPNAPMPTSDSANAAFQGVVSITPGTPVAAARSIGFVITTGGNVTLTLADSSTITLALTANTSLQTLPFAVTNVSLGTGTAGTFWNLK